MAKAIYKVEPAILHWAVDQVPDDSIDDKMRGNIKSWMDGTKTPTFCQIQDMSKKLHIPLGYFFLKTPPAEKINLLEFRTVDSVQLLKPSRDLIDTINIMEERQEWMAEYRERQGMDPLPVVGKAKGISNPIKIAEIMRTDLGLERDWSVHTKSTANAFKVFRTSLVDAGILVMMNGIVGSNTHRPLNIAEFRAFAIADNMAPLIFINRSDSDGARLFSLVHEAAHIWIGHDDLYNDRVGKVKNGIEALCNAVSAEVLAPEQDFIREWKNNTDIDVDKKIEDIATIFHCSGTVIARRALDKGLIDEEMYQFIAKRAISIFEKKKREDKEEKSSQGNYYGNVESRLDKAFMKAICESVVTGELSYPDAYRLTNTSRKTFDQVAADLGGVIAW